MSTKRAFFYVAELFDVLLVLCVICFLVAFSHCQDAPPLTVHPYIAGGAILNGSGQDNVGGSLAAGIQLAAPHLWTYSEAGYETGGKTNDNVNTSSAGHARLLANETLAHFGPWYAGVGIDWSKFYTPAYSKSHIHPRATVGRDFSSGYVSRVLVSYVHPGTDWQNGVQGFEAQGWWVGHHAFLRMTVGGYVCHTTLTDRTNHAMTVRQLSEHSMTSQFQALAGWRF